MYLNVELTQTKIYDTKVIPVAILSQKRQMLLHAELPQIFKHLVNLVVRLRRNVVFVLPLPVFVVLSV